MSGREIDRFLTERHVLPYRLGSAVNERHLIRIGPFPVHTVANETREPGGQLTSCFVRIVFLPFLPQ